MNDMTVATNQLSGRRQIKTDVIIYSIAIGTVLFGIVGSMSERTMLGVVAGSAIGLLLGICWSMRPIGWITVWTTVFAVGGGVLGPACDAGAIESALAGAVIGAFIGCTGWRGLTMLVGGMIGVNVGAAGGESLMIPGVAVGALIGWFVGDLLKPRSRNGA